MRRIMLVGVIGTAAVTALAMHGLGQQNRELKTFMRAKLAHSQKVLEGLVEEDYAKIAKNAQEMSLLSLAGTWQVLNTAEYVDFSRKFRNSADKLSEMAKKKNLEQTTKAFNEVTTRCVECHKYLRDVKYAANVQDR
jgi:cytochrome c556